MLKLANAKTLTFDCYGPLIDWENGAYTALRDIYGLSYSDVSNDDLIQTFLELVPVSAIKKGAVLANAQRSYHGSYEEESHKFI